MKQSLMLCMVALHCSATSFADTLPIVSYSMWNGDVGAQTYFDDTYGGPGATGDPNNDASFLSGGLGQLTNGVFASATDIFDDEWVGWYWGGPIITVDLGTPQFINSVSVHAHNLSPNNDVGAPGSANLSYSLDNVNFTSLGPYNTTIADRSGDDPRWVDLPFNATARYARLELFDGVKEAGTNPGYKPWIFLDEIRVDGSSAPPGFSFPDFSSTAGLRFRGSAARVEDVLRVTPATPLVSGSAFTADRVALAAGNSFNTHFRFRITNSGGISDEDGTGADGLVFVIDGGTLGGSIGYGHPGLAIEFDTYNNGPAFADPNGNHVGIDLNGSIVSVQTQTEAVRFNNGEVWDAWVDYDGMTDELEVRWSSTGVRPDAAQLARSVDLAALLGQNTAFVGFTSSTAAAWGNHDVLSWEFFGASLAPSTAVEGDFDENGAVDAADYVVWRKNPGGIYTQTDYNMWRANFGQASGSGGSADTSVPEPTAFAITVLALGLTRAPRRRVSPLLSNIYAQLARNPIFSHPDARPKTVAEIAARLC